jgi:molybdopterin synthase catalytic subunit
MHNPFRPILAGRALDGCRFMAEAKNVVDSIHHRIGRAISESKAVARLTSRRHQARAIESCSTCIATYSKRLRR